MIRVFKKRNNDGDESIMMKMRQRQESTIKIGRMQEGVNQNRKKKKKKQGTECGIKTN